MLTDWSTNAAAGESFADHKAQLLKMLETGSYPYFIFCHERAYELKDTDYNHLYAIHYGDWLDLAAEMYRTVNAVLAMCRTD